MYIFNIGGNRPASGMLFQSDVPASNTAAAITLVKSANTRYVLHKVIFSYSAAPTGGRLTITGGQETLDIDIIVGGPGGVDLPPYSCLLNTDCVITLAAGGSGIGGKLNISYSIEP